MRSFKGFEKGVNFGGWFSQCPHTTERYDTFVTERDFAVVAGWGADHVRIPVDYNLLEQDAGVWREDGFARLDKAIGWCKKHGLNMVLDLHKTAGFSFDSGEKESGFFESDALQERFYRLWEELARRFARYADFVAFELLNEVTDQSLCAAWNRIAGQCIGRIRAVSDDAKRAWILVGGYWNNSIDALGDIDVPLDDHIVYNFHCYEPLLFTHQGAYWVQGMPRDLRIPFPGTIAEYTQKAQSLGQHASRLLDGLSGSMVDGAVFDQLFSKAVAVAEERDVPLYCGEYGVIDLASPADTVAWFCAIHKAFVTYNIGRAVWSYRQMDFGLSDDRAAPFLKDLLPLL